MTTLRRWRLILAHLTLATTCVVMLITSRSLAGAGTTGDFPLFFQAGRDLVAGLPLHAPGRGYVYGPFPALLFAPLGPLGLAGAAWALAVFGTAAFWFCVMIGARAALRAFAVDRDRLIDAEVALIGLLLCVDKARLVISGGQTDMLVLLPLVLAVAWAGPRPGLAGAALGFAANVKYTTLVFLPFLLWRRQWRAAAAMIGSGVLFALSPALVGGWARVLADWRASLEGLAHLVGEGPADPAAAPFGDVTFQHSVSITSALSRWLIPGHGRLAADAATAGVALAVLGVCGRIYRRNQIPLLVRRRDDPAADVLRLLEWTGVIVGLLAFSPQTQGRHFVLLLPLYLAAGVMLRKPRAPRLWLIVGLLILQAGLMLPPGGIERLEPTVQAWRATGGASWCLLIMFACYLSTGLRTARAMQHRQPALAHATSGGTTVPGP